MVVLVGIDITIRPINVHVPLLMLNLTDVLSRVSCYCCI